jgi:predicted alpha/beta-fold hydrolase
MIPFLLYSYAPISYSRRWFPVPEAFGPSYRRRPEPEKSLEAVAVDFSFPSTGFNPKKTIYVILHGLNGGSAEEYVMDFVSKANKDGHTVAIMIARGLSKTPVTGDSIFNGARCDDIDTVVNIIRKVVGPSTKIAGVGFSMGGVILANYMAKMGKQCGLDAGVSLGGCLDCVANHSYWESRELWQQVLCARLKESVMGPSIGRIVKKGIKVSEVSACKSIEDLDRHVVAKYFGYKDLNEYHNDLSAGADNKLNNLAKPLLVLNAINDPIVGKLLFFYVFTSSSQ